MGGQSRPQPMTMGMQQANPSTAMGFGQMMTPQPMAQPQKSYGPIGGMVNNAQQQVQQPAPTSQMNGLMTNFAAPQPAPPSQNYNTLPSPGMRSFAPQPFMPNPFGGFGGGGCGHM